MLCTKLIVTVLSHQLINKRHMNKVFLFGRLGKDPEDIKGGSKFSLATTERKKVGDIWEEYPEWHHCVVFGKRAEALQKYVRKGDQLSVMGSIRTSSYDKDGETRYATDIIVSDFEFVGKSTDNRPTDNSKKDPEPITLSDDDIPF